MGGSREMNSRICQILLHLALPGLAGMLAASALHADGECFKGYHETTEAERTAMAAILETAKSALPDAPEGWVIQGDDLISVPSGYCLDFDIWSYQHTRYYQRVDDQEAQDAAIRTSADLMMADIQAKQPRLDAIMAKNEELSKAVLAAVQAGDYARVDAINQEIAANGAEYESILAEGGVQAQANADLEASGRDHQMSVSVAINPLRASAEDWETVAVPAGASAAFLLRVEDNQGLLSEVVLLGPWEPAPDFGLQQVLAKGTAPEKAHAISVHIYADEGRLPAVIDAIDFTALAGLIVD